METFTEATERYLKAAQHLTDEHAPLVAALRHAANSLDRKFQAATLTQYRLIYVELARKDDGLSEGKSELAAFLEGVKLVGS